MTDEEIRDCIIRMELMQSNGGCGTPFYIACVFILALLFTSCKTQYVPVETVHTEYVHTIDSVKQVDSVFHEKETVVMQVDSEAMAQYGIKLAAAEKAWLIKSKELEREISRLEQLKADTVTIHDSIPVIVPKEKELTVFQKFKLKSAMWFMGLFILLLVLLSLKIVHKW